MFTFGDPESSTQWCDECKEEGNGIPLAYAQVDIHESLFPTKHQPNILFLDFAINLCRPCLGVKSVEQTRGMKNRVCMHHLGSNSNHGEAIFDLHANQLATREWDLQRGHVCFAFLWENYYPCFHG